MSESRQILFSISIVLLHTLVIRSSKGEIIMVSFFYLISCFSAFRTVLSKKWISVKGVGPYDPLRTPPPLRLGKKPKFVPFF